MTPVCIFFHDSVMKNRLCDQPVVVVVIIIVFRPGLKISLDLPCSRQTCNHRARETVFSVFGIGVIYQCQAQTDLAGAL